MFNKTNKIINRIIYQGRPRKSSPPEEERIFDCFGRAANNNNNNYNQVSKNQLKKQKKEEKKNNRKAKGQGNGRGRGRGRSSLTPSCIKANPDDVDNVDEDQSIQRRLTEKRQPGDIEEMLAREEELARLV